MSYFKPALLASLLALAGSAFSQALPVGVSPVFAPTVTSTGLTYSGGVANAANAANITFANAANGPVYARTAAKIALGGGATADIALASAPTGAAIAGALGRFALKIAGPLAAGVALYDLYKELGFDLSRNPDGSLKVGKVQTSSSVDGYIYSNAFMPGCTSNFPAGSVSGSVDTVGSAIAAWATSSCAGYIYTYRGGTKSPQDSPFFTNISLDMSGAGVDHYSIGITHTTAPPATDPVPATAQEVADAIAAKSGWPQTSAINRAINDAIASGEAIPLPQPTQITGPASVPLSPQVVNKPDGTTETTTPTKNLTYSPPAINVTNNTTSVVTNAAGQPVGTTTTAKPGDMPETCGYPGGPPCKIDESGTPDKAVDKVYDPLADAVKTSKDAGTQKISGTEDKSGLFSGWSVLWSAPAVVACSPYVLPNWNGQSMGTLDPCPVVDGVRTVMAYIWAAVALFACIGMVRESIQQG